MFEILKKKARKLLGKDPIAIDGYRLSFADQSKILKQYLTLYGMGFGVPHHFERLGEDILKLWIDTVRATNDPLTDEDFDTLRWKILDCFRQEPDDKVIKKNLKPNREYILYVVGDEITSAPCYDVAKLKEEFAPSLKREHHSLFHINYKDYGH